MKRVVRKIGAACLSFAMLFNANMPTVLIAEDVPQESTPEPIEEEVKEQPVETEEPGAVSDGEPVVTVDEEPAPEAVPTENTPEPADQPAAEPAAEQPVSETPTAEEIQPTEQPEENTEPEAAEEPDVSYQIIGVFQGDDGQSVESELNPGEDLVSVSELAQPLEGYTWTGSAVITRPDETVDTVTAISDSAYVVKNEADGDYTVSFDDAFGSENTTVYVVFAYTKDIVVEEPESEPEPAYEHHFEFENHRVHVTADAHEGAEIPEGSELHADYLVPGSSAYRTAVAAILAGTDADPDKTEFELYDIYFTHEGNRIEPNDNVDVTLSFKRTVAPKKDNGEIANAEVVHVDNDNNGEVVSQQNVVTSESGIEEISFTNDSFSPYGVKYTVDYTYSGYTWSMEGGTQIYLSELFGMLGIAEDAANVTGVEFSNYDLISVEQTEGNWILKSLKPFETSEVLTVTMANGDKYLIQVEDDAYTVDSNPLKLTELTEGSGSLNVSLTSTVPSDGFARNATLDFSLSFEIDDAKLSNTVITTTDGQKTVHNVWEYDLSTFIQDNPLLGIADVTNGELINGGQQVGTFSIVNNKVVFTVDPEWLAPKTTGVGGSCNFSIQLDRDKVGDGDSTSFQFPGTTDTVQIPLQKITVNSGKEFSVDGSTYNGTNGATKITPEANDDGSYTLHYRVGIETNGALNTLVLEDTLGEGQTLKTDSVVLYNDRWNKTGETTPLTPSVSGQNFTIDIAQAKGGKVPAGGYAVYYDVIISKDAVESSNEFVNTAKWKYSGNKETPQSQTDVKITKKLAVDKGVTVSADGNTYSYTVTIGDGTYSLGGHKITDTMSDNQSFGGNFTITGENLPDNLTSDTLYASTNESLKDSNYTHNFNGTLFDYTFPDEYTGTGPITITYTTTIEDDKASAAGISGKQNVTNKTEDNHGDDHGEKGTSQSHDYGVPETAATLTKDFVSWDETNDKANWKLTIVLEDDGSTSFKNVQIQPVQGEHYTLYGSTREDLDILWDTVTVKNADNQEIPTHIKWKSWIEGDDADPTGNDDQLCILFPELANTEANRTLTLEFETAVTSGLINAAGVGAEVYNKAEVLLNNVKQDEDDASAKHPNGGVQTSKSVNYDEANDIYNWSVVINSQKIEVSPDYKPVFSDTIPAGMELVGGKIHISPDGISSNGIHYYSDWGADVNVTVSGQEIQPVVVTDFTPWTPFTQPAGISGMSYTITYQTKLTDAEKADMQGSTETKTYTNIAHIKDENNVVIGEPTESVERKYTFITKTDNSPETLDSDIISYTIVINPEGIPLNNGNPLVMTDTIPAGTEFITNSYTLTAGAKLNYDSINKLITVTAPDATTVTFTYRIKVDDLFPGGATFSNTATLSGIDGAQASTNENHIVKKHSGSIHGATDSITIRKIDADNPAKSLDGATFKLDRITINPQGEITKIETDWKTATTAEGGSLIFTELQPVAHPGEDSYYLYRFREVNPPAGYKISNPIYASGYNVMLYVDDDYSHAQDLDELAENANNIVIDLVEGGHSFIVSNVQTNDIPVRKVWKSNDGAADAVPEEGLTVTVKLQQSADGGTNWTDYIPEGETSVAQVELNADNNWENAFRDIPESFVNEGVTVNYMYRVVETSSSDRWSAQNEGIAVLENNVYVLENRERVGSLKVTKSFSDNVLPENLKNLVTFEVTGPNNYRQTFTYAQMTNGEKQFDNLPLGDYIVKESATFDGYTWTKSVTVNNGTPADSNEATATVTNGETATVAFTNSYTKKTGNATIQATKSMTNGTLTGDDFEFQLVETDKNGTPLTGKDPITAKNNAEGEVTFPEITYDTTGEYYYKVTEVGRGTTQNGVKYSNAEYLVKVTVTEDINEPYLITTVDKTAAELTFVNEYTSSGSVSIPVKKVLEGRTLQAEEFEFYLERKNEGGTWTRLQVRKNKADGTVTFDDLAYTQNDVGKGQRKIITYRIVEKQGTNSAITYAEPVEFTVTITDNGQGTINAVLSDPYSASNPITLKNTYKSSGSVQLHAKKTLTGKELTDGEFTFILRDSNGTEIGSASNASDGTVTFGEINYTQEDLAKSPLKYTITELDESEAGVTYDAHTETVTVTLTDDGKGNITATPQYTSGNDAYFVNQYHASGAFSISAQKTLTGRTLNNEEFTFELYEGDSASGKLLQIKKNSGSNVTFDAISLTESDFADGAAVITKIYTIKEVKGSASGVTYDEHLETVTVKATLSGSAITTSVEYDADGAVFNNAYTSEGSVSLTAKKVLEGKDLTANAFTFRLKRQDGGNVTYKDGSENKTAAEITTTNDASGNVAFPEIVYTQEDVAASPIKYEISEIAGEQGGITYDTHTEVVTVTLTDNGSGTITATPKYEHDSAVFRNTYTTTPVSVNLDVNKTLTGKTLEANMFDFTLAKVSAKDHEGTDINYPFNSQTRKNSADGKVTFDAITFEKPGVYTFTVYEASTDGKGVKVDTSKWTVTITVTDNGSGALEATTALKQNNSDISGTTITFNNTYSASGRAQVEAKKTITNRALKEGEFEFSLTRKSAPDGVTDTNPDQTGVKNDAGGKVSFAALTYTVPGTYTYTMKETSVDGNGVKVDTTEHVVTVTVTDAGNGTLNTNVSYDGGSTIPEFRNTYTPTNTTVDIRGTKKMEGRALQANEFNFTLTPKSAPDGVTDTNPVQQKTNLSNGSIVFDRLTFSKPGTYTYEVKETSAGGDGVTVDNSVYTLEVVVTDDGLGTLTPKTRILKNNSEVSSITFTNRYDHGSTTAQVEAEKRLEGRELKAGEFEFSLTKKSAPAGVTDSNPNQTGVTNDAAGKVTFANMSYTEAGEYTYELKETSVSTADIDVDSTVYTVVVNVTDDGHGNLSSSVTYKKGETDVEKAEFVNKYLSGSLEIGKAVVGNDVGAEETNKQFTFNITLTDADGTKVSGTFDAKKGLIFDSASDVKVTFTDGAATVKLKHNEYVWISGLPNGTSYTVAEEASSAAGYVLEESTGTSGTIETGKEKAAAFKNRHDTFGDLQIVKKLEGNATDAAEEFPVKVTLYESDGTTQASSINGGADKYGVAFDNGVAEFTVKAGQPVTLTNLDNGLKYKVEETDSKGYVPEIANGEGTIDGSKTGDKALLCTITNTRNLYGGFSVTKQTAGNAADVITDFEFTATLSDKTISGPYGELTFNNGVATFTLKADDTVTATGLPNGVGYTIAEKDYSSSGYTTTGNNITRTVKGVVGTAGEVTENNIDSTNKETVTNTRNSDGTLSITKKVAGNQTADETFTVTVTLSRELTDEEKQHVIGADFTDGKTAAFTISKDQTVSIEGLPNGIGYTVQETLADESVYTASYTVNGRESETGSGTISEYNESKVEITNTGYAFGGLKLTKETAGNDPDKKTWFAYKITLTSDDLISGVYGDVEFRNNVSVGPADTGGDVDYSNGKVPAGYIKVRKDTPVYIIGLPAGVGYTVVEDDYAETYDKQESSDNTGTINAIVNTSSPTLTAEERETIKTSGDINVTTFTNTRDRYGKLVVEKVVNGNPDPNGTNKQFTFNVHVEGVNGTYSGVEFNDGNAVVTLAANDSKTIEGLPLDADFNVAEETSGNEGYLAPQYQLSYRVQVYDADGNKVKDENGKDVKETRVEDGAHSGKINIDQRVVTVTNTYQRVTAKPEFTKKFTVTGTAETTTKTFEFKISSVSGPNDVTVPMPDPATAKVELAAGESKTFDFGELAYTEQGDYIYKVTETTNDVITGMTYAEDVYVKVSVTEDAETKALKADVSYGPSETDAGGTDNVFENKYERETTEIKVHKTWEDRNDVLKLRPKSITVKLKAGDKEAASAELNAANNWTYTFKDLPKYDYLKNTEITYSVEEVSADGYKSSIAEAADGYEITNTIDFTEISVKKVWNDANDADKIRPDSVSVQLYAGDKACGDPVVLDEKNGWKYTWSDLKKSEGSTDIAYKVEEVNVSNEYVSEVSGNATSGFTITNTHEAIKGSLKVSKTVKSDDKNDKTKAFKFKVTLDDKTVAGTFGDMTFKDGVAEFTLKDGESKTATGLLSGVKYTVEEEKADGFTVTKTGDTGTIKANATAEASFTNTKGTPPTPTPTPTPGPKIDTRQVRVVKAWKDGDNAGGSRPASVTVHLLADGVDTGLTVQLSAANNWNYVWYDLPVYTSYGNIISYSVAEDPVPGYTAEYSGSMNSGYTITNKKRVIPKTDDTFEALKLQAILLGSMLMAMLSSFLLRKTAER